MACATSNIRIREGSVRKELRKHFVLVVPADGLEVNIFRAKSPKK